MRTRTLLFSALVLSGSFLIPIRSKSRADGRKIWPRITPPLTSAIVRLKTTYGSVEQIIGP